MICIFQFTATPELRYIGFVDNYDKKRYLSFFVS